jgi:G3E family GTPase
VHGAADRGRIIGRFVQRLPVTLLAGFPGAGKTTLLNQLVRQSGMAGTLVVTDESGAIGLDHLLVALTRNDSGVRVSSGCPCCTIPGGLVRTLREAPWRYARNGTPWFERVVVQAAGLADPIPILHTLIGEPSVTRRYRLDGVVTVVDAAAAMSTLDPRPEASRQVAVADRLLVSKVDLVEAPALAALQAHLRALNPGAAQRLVRDGRVDARELIGIGREDIEPALSPQDRPGIVSPPDRPDRLALRP